MRRDDAGRAAARELVVVVLRALGVLDLLALGAVFLPLHWMAVAHAWLGLGTMPEGPLVGYLARSASALYALHGALILFLSFDVRRYWSLITFLAVLAVLHGAVMLGIDIAEGMPVWWTAIEGLGFAGTGAVVLAAQWAAGPPNVPAERSSSEEGDAP
jgi:hypothetical protein